eukprot:1974766-Pleurochrysis_carterae.AAC.2
MRNEPSLGNEAAAEAKQKLIMQWDGVRFSHYRLSLLPVQVTYLVTAAVWIWRGKHEAAAQGWQLPQGPVLEHLRLAFCPDSSSVYDDDDDDDDDCPAANRKAKTPSMDMPPIQVNVEADADADADAES